MFFHYQNLMQTLQILSPLSHKSLCKLTSFPIKNPKTPNPNNGQEKKPTPTVQIAPHFTNNPPPTSSKDGSHVQITRPTLMTILAIQVTLKDKERRAHVDTTTKA